MRAKKSIKTPKINGQFPLISKTPRIFFLAKALIFTICLQRRLSYMNKISVWRFAIYLFSGTVNVFHFYEPSTVVKIVMILTKSTFYRFIGIEDRKAVAACNHSTTIPQFSCFAIIIICSFFVVLIASLQDVIFNCRSYERITYVPWSSCCHYYTSARCIHFQSPWS